MKDMKIMKIRSQLSLICLLCACSIFFNFASYARALEPIYIGTHVQDDPVEKILQNMGAKTWHPDEPPEKLYNMLEKTGSHSSERRSIQECITISSVETKTSADALLVAVRLQNGCSRMVSYFAKAQLLNAENFPLSRETQTSHTQIPAGLEKVELIEIRKRDFIEAQSEGQTSGHVYVQVVSHDQHAYGAIGTKHILDTALAVPTAEKELQGTSLFADCLKDINVQAKIIPAQEHRNSVPGRKPQKLFRMSYIFSAHNTCDQVAQINGTVRILDKQGFDQFGRMSSFRSKIPSGQLTTEHGSEIMVPNIIESKDQFDALFEVSVNGIEIWEKRLALSDM